VRGGGVGFWRAHDVWLLGTGLAAEAIGHPQRDSFDSRLGLIGLRECTPAGAGVKGTKLFNHGRWRDLGTDKCRRRGQ
jgi:hypothetical protein